MTPERVLRNYAADFDRFREILQCDYLANYEKSYSRMYSTCQHCSTSYGKDSGVEGFCCAGCREVYALIQGEGLSDYYHMQDRAADPVKDRALSEMDSEALGRAQAIVEESASIGKGAFSVVGLSCMGCVWLIQRLSTRQVGVLRAEASLNERKLDLEWATGRFDLKILAGELQRFGYHMEPTPLEGRPGASSLSVRLGLCLVFTLNAGVLSAYQYYVEASNGLVQLLCLICLSFVFILGALPFFTTVLRAFRVRRVHVDLGPASVILASVFFSAYLLLGSHMMVSTAALVLSTLITAILLARYLVRYLSFRRS
ncbi:heavy metal translocating P-type ATPase metal-binding domain-containing protein [Puniceicoccaceae bacterium]|nr:heavy metal translocating P-type ATPase metal-binding domain-containing protein [Puniceicoccaceae bacterium]